jgi:hypothetical protein
VPTVSTGSAKWVVANGVNSKAALAYINAGDHEAAAKLIEQCPAGEAATQYLRFLVAINRGSVEATIEAVHLIIECPDVQGKQLILMA